MYRTTILLLLTFLAGCSSSSRLNIDDDLAVSRMSSMEQITAEEMVFYPANDVDKEPLQKGSRRYLVTTTREVGSTRSVVNRKPSHRVKYGILIDLTGNIEKIIPIEDPYREIRDVRDSYVRVSYEPALKDGQPVNSYIIVEEQF